MRFSPLLLMPLLGLAQINDFGWPHGDMNTQKRISSTFDECREDRDHFHNGTDMPLAPGGQVLSIMEGLVTGIGSDWIRVEDFAYVHVIPNAALDIGSTVAQGAVVGVTDSYAHIHLNYGGGASGHPYGNPLLPGKIKPFEDNYKPRSPLITLVQDGTNNAFSGSLISGKVDIIAQAADTTDLQAGIDMNNGIYKIGWALYNSDKSSLLEGPHYWFEANRKYPNNYINKVYAAGSSTSIYRYIVTNKVYYSESTGQWVDINGFLDCTAYSPGNYQLAVMSVDTRDNWDTSYVHITMSDQDLIPPGQPTFTFVGPDPAGNLLLEWIPPIDSDLSGYFLEFSFDGLNWATSHGPSVLTKDHSSLRISNFQKNELIHFRLFAVDDAPIPNYSLRSDTYSARLTENTESILIVDGFDRINGSWTSRNHDFATYYAQAIEDCGSSASISTASNEWVISGGSLAEYSSLFWFLGDDSRTDETFDVNEQAAISNYLASGGALFASGAEIAYDLSAGSAADKDFMNQVLHIGYAGDNSGSFTVNGVGEYFSGQSFSYGSTPYYEDWPDYFNTANGGQVVLRYANGRNAGVGYRTNTSATLVIGFTFETVAASEMRSELIGRTLGFFKGTTETKINHVPLYHSISAVYPNPFNASVKVEYTIQNRNKIQIEVYDMGGRKIYNSEVNPSRAGYQTWHWNARNNQGFILESGTYIVRIQQEGMPSLSSKLLLLK